MNWREVRPHEPMELTPLEQMADAMLLFENFERYCAQSAATGVNAPAPLPPRPALTGAHH